MIWHEILLSPLSIPSLFEGEEVSRNRSSGGGKSVFYSGKGVCRGGLCCETLESCLKSPPAFEKSGGESCSGTEILGEKKKMPDVV